MPSNVFAVVVTYNGMKYLDKCLISLQASLIPLKIIVIDNNSTDASANFIEINFPEITLIKNTTNLGFGKANNIGLKLAYKQNAQHILLINQDAWIYPDTVKNLIEAQNTDENNYIVTPILIQAHEKFLEIHFEKLIGAKYCNGLISDFITNRENLKIFYKVEFMHAAVWLLSQNCLNNIGGFDPIFPHNSEDNDYVNRVKFFGKKIGVCPFAIAVHDTETQFGTNANKSKYTRRRLYFVTNIAQHKNINHSFVRGILQVFSNNLKAIISHLFKFELKLILDRFIAFGKYLINIRLIYRHRNISKNCKASFLN